MLVLLYSRLPPRSTPHHHIILSAAASESLGQHLLKTTLFLTEGMEVTISGHLSYSRIATAARSG